MKLPGQDDAVVDGDAVVVDGDVERPDAASITTPALACIEFSGLSGCAPSTCAGGRAHRQRQRLERHQALPGTLRKLVAVDEKNDCPSDGARKPVLSEPRTTKRAVGLHAHGQLAVDRVAEVAVVLGAAGDAEPQPAEHVPFDVDVAGDAVARLVHLVGRTEAGEHLRADRRAMPPALVRHAAVAVRVRLAGDDLVVLAAVLGAESRR